MKTAYTAFAEVRGYEAGLRALGIEPDGPADQVQRLRDRVVELEALDAASTDVPAQNERGSLVDYLIRVVREGEPHCGGMREYWCKELGRIGLDPEGDPRQAALLRTPAARRHYVVVQERDDARAECARLRERVAELEAQLDKNSDVIEASLVMRDELRDRVAGLEKAAQAYYTVVQERDDERAECARLRDLVSGLERGQLDCQSALAKSEAERDALRADLKKAEKDAKCFATFRDEGYATLERVEKERDALRERADKALVRAELAEARAKDLQDWRAKYEALHELAYDLNGVEWRAKSKEWMRACDEALVRADAEMAARKALLETIERAEKQYCIEGDYAGTGENQPFILAMGRMARDVERVSKQRDERKAEGEAWRAQYEASELNFGKACEERDRAVARAETAERNAGPLQTWIDKANEWQAKYEALLAKFTPPRKLWEYAQGRHVSLLGNAAADFIAALPEPPKRKTREEIVAGVLQGAFAYKNYPEAAEQVARNILAALDASEAPHG